MSSLLQIPNNSPEARIANLEQQLGRLAAAGSGGPWGGIGSCYFTTVPLPSTLTLTGSYLQIDDHYAVANGVAVSRTQFPALAAAYAANNYANYGAGDGSTTFNLPDSLGREFVCVGTHADVNSCGKNEGWTADIRTPVHNTSISPNPHGHGSAMLGGVAPNLANGSFTGIVYSSIASTSLSGGPGGTRPSDSAAFFVGVMLLRVL